MLRVAKLKAALAAVPADQPCTPVAVKALYTAGHASAQHIAAAGRTVQASPDLLDACVEQQVPGACMPVLAWLAAGLRNGLPPDASQQAHELACALVGVVSRVLPDNMQDVIPAAEQVALFRRMCANHLDQLGTTEAMCRQLADVAAALLATTFVDTTTTTTSSSSNSSGTSSNPASASTAAPPLQQRGALALLWERFRGLLRAILSMIGMDALAPALTSSGLYQVLLEGTLLLLGADPAAYPQTSQAKQQVWDSISNTMQAAIFLTVELAKGVQSYTLFGPTSHLHSSRNTSSGSGRTSWVPPLFKLQILLLAKMQWDVRQCPEDMSSSTAPYPWPSRALTRAVPQLRSPCVAGDLLRQRAPALLQHTYPYRHCQQTPWGQRWEVAEVRWCIVPPNMVGVSLDKVHRVWQCYMDVRDRPVPDALDLGLLVEVAELYCLVCPTGSTVSVSEGAWRPLMTALADGLGSPASAGQVPPYFATFAATCGDALVSIAEYLTEDVLLVMANDGQGIASSRVSRATSSRISSSGGGSSSSSSSSSAQKPVAGGTNPGVTVEHRVAWAQRVVGALSMLLAAQQEPQGVQQDQTGAVYRLINDRTVPRLRVLMETNLRTPVMLGGPPASILFLPQAFPALHAATSSSAGSHALLSAATTAAKVQRVTNGALAALVGEGCVLAPAIARIQAAAPGPLEHVVGQKLMQRPAYFVDEACHTGWQLSCYAQQLMVRGVALLDALLGPAAAYLGTRVTPGEDSRLAGLEELLVTRWRSPWGGEGFFPYLDLLADSPEQVEGILQQLTAGLREWQNASEVKRAAKLAEKMGAAGASEELQQALVGMGLEGGPGTVSTRSQQQGEGRQATSNSASRAASDAPSEAAGLLRLMCEVGALQEEEVLAAGDPAQWAAAVEPPTSADRRVAITAVFMACKLAGALAKLPQLLEQVQRAAAQQAWGQDLTSRTCLDLRPLQDNCNTLATWALLLAPVLEPVMPAEQAAHLQEAAASDSRSSSGQAEVNAEVASRVLGLLGHVGAPGAPGCSYPACCNLEARSEVELPVQVCSKCHGVRYCCREHQVAHWKAGHKQEECLKVQAAAKHVCEVAAGRSDQVDSRQ